MKISNVSYWVATAVIGVETLAGGFVDLTHGREAIVVGRPVVDVVTSLGYPVYLLAILGIWKIPGAIILVIPGFLRVKEWAYAGMVFELSGAAVLHATRHQVSDVAGPLVLLGFALASWALRPSWRTLGAHSHSA